MSQEVDEIQDLLANYALALDVDDVDGCLQLFTDDAEYEVYGRTFVGLDGIGAMFHQAPGGLHLCGATRIEINGDIATARSQVLFVNAQTQQLRPAHYDDELVRRDGRWLFWRRRCRFITEVSS